MKDLRGIIEVLLDNAEMSKFDNDAIKKAMRDRIAELAQEVSSYKSDMNLFDTDILVSENYRLSDELEEITQDRDNLVDYIDGMQIKLDNLERKITNLIAYVEREL